MQALSSRAHAFSVEALVGKPSKRMKVSEKQDSDSTGERESIFTGQSGDQEEAFSAAWSPGGSSEEPAGRADGAGGREGESARGPDTELQGSELWKRFYEIGTEMIITKAGRRMFPSVRVKVRNLDPCQQYYVAMDVMPVDSKRYRYVYHSSQWMVAGNTDHSCISPRLYVHPDSPCTGETWMRQVISFDRVKLTNNEMDDKGHIILQSMHKYKPRVHVIRHDPRMDLSQIQSLPAEGVHTFSFPETEFTTVTAYQNQQITKLKIDRNPFAKGFRDPGRNRGVLDGLLESYPWRGPLSLDFKPFSVQLQGGSMLQNGTMKNFLPFSSSASLLPLSVLSCPDATLHSLRGDKTSPTSPRRAFSPLGVDRLSLSSLPPLTDFTLLSALHEKKPLHCRDLCAPRGPPCPCLPLHGALGPGASPVLPHFSDTSSPYCVYSYTLPLNPQLTALSRHAKLTGDAADCLLRSPPWSPASNHCL